MPAASHGKDVRTDVRELDNDGDGDKHGHNDCLNKQKSTYCNNEKQLWKT